MTDRTFRTSRGSAEVEVEPEVQVIEEERMEGNKFIKRAFYIFSVILVVRL